MRANLINFNNLFNYYDIKDYIYLFLKGFRWEKI